MHAIDHDIYKLFDENVERARQSYKPKKDTSKGSSTHPARSSSLNNALKNIQERNVEDL